MTNSRPELRVGVVGLGLAANMVLPAIEKMDGARVVACCDIDEGQVGVFSARYRAKPYTEYDAMCADPEVDAIWVATPNLLHCPHSVLAMRHGKHVIVEKPMAVSLEDALLMIRTAEEQGVHLICGGSRSASPVVAGMRRVIESGRLGSLRAMTSWASTDWLLRPRRPDELDETKGGGVVYRQAPHQIDTVRLLGGGRVRSVRGFVGNWMAERDNAPGYFSALLSFENGIAATLTYSGFGYFSGHELFEPEASGPDSPGLASRIVARREIVAGGRDEAAAKLGRLQPPAATSAPRRPSSFLADLGLLVASCEHGEVRQSPRGIYVYSDDGVAEEQLDGSVGSPEIQELLDALDSSKPILHGARWGLATLEVCLAIMQSHRESREVYLEHQVGLPAANA